MNIKRRESVVYDKRHADVTRLASQEFAPKSLHQIFGQMLIICKYLIVFLKNKFEYQHKVSAVGTVGLCDTTEIS